MSDYVTQQPVSAEDDTPTRGVLGGTAAFAYGLICYAVFFVAFVYAIGFVGNIIAPKSVDLGGADVPLQEALIVNVLLLGVFAFQHSMVAPGI